jgi:hypothetical protein
MFNDRIKSRIIKLIMILFVLLIANNVLKFRSNIS